MAISALRRSTALVLAMPLLLPQATHAADDFQTVFARATAYVAEFESQFASVIWHEA